MEIMLTRKTRHVEVEEYRGWSLSDRLELLAFDARLAGVPPALLEALWDAIDQLPGATRSEGYPTAGSWGTPRAGH
jgi:hypothetical protein